MLNMCKTQLPNEALLYTIQSKLLHVQCAYCTKFYSVLPLLSKNTAKFPYIYVEVANQK